MARQRYQLVQHILKEMDSDEEEREEKKKEKEQLNTIEGQTLNGNRPNPLKKRDLDGNIVDTSDPNKKVKTNTFEIKSSTSNRQHQHSMM